MKERFQGPSAGVRIDWVGETAAAGLPGGPSTARVRAAVGRSQPLRVPRKAAPRRGLMCEGPRWAGAGCLYTAAWRPL